MGRLIDCDLVYNALQITSDKFGVASQVVWQTIVKMLGQIPTANAIRVPENVTNEDIIPFLMHKEMGIPLSECKKAYDVAIDYLRSQGKVRG